HLSASHLRGYAARRCVRPGWTPMCLSLLFMPFPSTLVGMGERVRVLRHGGRLLAVKEVGPAGADALRAEAAVLERVRTAGVVDLIGLRAGDPPALLTAWVGPRSLADLPVPL